MGANRTRFVWRTMGLLRNRGRAFWDLRIKNRTLWEWVGLWARRKGLVPGGVVLPFGYTLSWDENWRGALDFLAGEYEPEVTRIFHELLKPGSTVVDVGANIGYYTLLGMYKVGDAGHVYSFEPDPVLSGVLSKNVRINKGSKCSVTILPMAVADFQGSASFYSDGTGVSGSLYSSSWPAAHHIVQVTTLDDFFRSQRWPRVDLIKIDAEGSELACLKGGRELFGRNPWVHLLMEINARSLQRAGIGVSDVFLELERLGFVKIEVVELGMCAVENCEMERLMEQVWKQPFAVVNVLCSRG